MPKALILNPNTSVPVTELLVQQAHAGLPASWSTHAATAAFGADYISSEAAYAIAAHAVLDAFARHGRGCDAVLIGCFGDPGLQALQELAGVPVVGLAEASMREAATFGRFSIVTGGARWAPILQRLAAGLGLAAALGGVHTLIASGAELAADRARALDLLGERCRLALAEDRSQAVILGGAALAGMGDELAARLGLPVIDSVSAGLRALVQATPASPSQRDGVRYRGLGASLEAWLMEQA